MSGPAGAPRRRGLRCPERPDPHRAGCERLDPALDPVVAFAMADARHRARAARRALAGGGTRQPLHGLPVGAPIVGPRDADHHGVRSAALPARELGASHAPPGHG